MTNCGSWGVPAPLRRTPYTTAACGVTPPPFAPLALLIIFCWGEAPLHTLPPLLLGRSSEFPSSMMITGKLIYPCPRSRLRVWSRARRVWHSRPASACSFSMILRLNLVFTHGIPPDFRGGVHLFIVYLNRAIRHWASPEFIGSPRNIF